MAPWPLFAADLINQDLDISLFPTTQVLQARVKMTRASDNMPWPQEYVMAPHAQITSLSADGMPLPIAFSQGRLNLSVAQDTKVLTLAYSIRYDDVVPQDIVGIEDPSYGVQGTILEEGVYLSGSSGWHPRAEGVDSLFKITVVSTDGLTGVTNGRMTAYDLTAGQMKVTWKTSLPQSTLSLAAGHYQLHRKELKGLQVMAFLTEGNAGLAEQYLDSIIAYLELYQTLFGPYPYEKFAVVENFFPTGYGLPGWTLIGNRVIKLPFITTTSLPHEIAHAWWGNAVEIDYDSGNWGEGLATYVADYYLKELNDPREAIEYRRKLVRDFASLVSAETDMPLVAFRGRMSKRDQAIGYGKAALVFHMLRGLIGDIAFWQGLQEIAREGRGKRYGWDDLQRHFENVTGDDLQGFFSQWLQRPGAPLLTVEDIEMLKVGTGWQVSGTVRQSHPLYALAIPLVLETETRRYDQVVGLYGEEDCFVFTVAERPVRLSLDPDNELFRQLYPEESPATINDLRAAATKLVVIARGAEALFEPSRDLLKGLHWQEAVIVNEVDYRERATGNHALLVIGWPENQALQPALPEPKIHNKQQFRLPGQAIADSETLFMVSRPRVGDALIAHFLPGSPAAALDTARRVSHYGRYSYLAFSNGINLVKGTWAPGKSPLNVSLDKERQP